MLCQVFFTPRECKRLPTLSRVRRTIETFVGQHIKGMSLIRVGGQHGGNQPLGVGQSLSHLLPVLRTSFPIKRRVGMVPLMMSLVCVGRSRDDDSCGIGWINAHAPQVMIVQSFIWSIPTLASIFTLAIPSAGSAQAIASRRIQTIGGLGMHKERMGVKWSIRLPIFPMFSPIQASHQCTRLDSDKQPTGNQRVRRNPAHMTGRWTRRKTPGRSRRKSA